MATGLGTAEINFGAFPGTNEVQVTVSGQSAISATSKAEAWIMADDATADHTASDHRYADCFIGLTCGTPSGGSGFTIYARTAEHTLDGRYAVRWVWAD